MFFDGSSATPSEFTGGKFTGYGVTPAQYETTDPVIQRAIENSVFFRSGKIRLLRTAPVEKSAGDTPPRPGQEAKTPMKAVIDVPDLSSARQQLMRLTGAPPASLRSRREMEEVAKAHNIEMKIDK